MAHRLAIQSNVPGFGHIWNVSQRVGGRDSCPNLPTDVELVKVLIKKALESPVILPAARRVPAPPLTVNSQFDAVVGYWIFRFQDHDGHPIIDGVASPARSLTYAPGVAWVIAFINFHAFKADKDFWNNLPQNKTLSQTLRSELSR